jgi:hypothetical protein
LELVQRKLTTAAECARYRRAHAEARIAVLIGNQAYDPSVGPRDTVDFPGFDFRRLQCRKDLTFGAGPARSSLEAIRCASPPRFIQINN